MEGNQEAKEDGELPQVVFPAAVDIALCLTNTRNTSNQQSETSRCERGDVTMVEIIFFLLLFSH